ncbi:penicillin-binding transpeptidase domain-containing protein [Jeotgalibacillus salarius]|uniref:PASTA domain-containing protein n=1 Tax=Jeotgalibacillus salarius TaxID=546023 RepID=A0A4Y8LC45_9BACL|nr:penicillin-binding transpeptidase domain-containing protein [Jeotgalibacillus salarius]TFE00236.1 PASTA domain-containing protein [Jeotgalibacillus salarius]
MRKLKKNWGAYLLFMVFGALFFLLITRFLTLQITGEAEGRDLAAQAQAQYARSQILEAERGKILDRNGEVIAEDTQTYKIVAVLDENLTTNEENPRHVIDPQTTASTLSEYLDLSEAEIMEILTQERKQVEFGTEGKDIPLEIKQQIEDAELPGIFFLQDLKRFYPNGIFSSHLIGYAQPETTEDGMVKTVGQMGVEKNLNEYLEGKNGELSFETDARGYLLPGGEEALTKAKDGHDVYLTLDKKIQTFLEDAMSQVSDEYNPGNMFGIVADAKTGEILAMSQRPTFDPDTRVGLSENWYNQIVESTFEPGSTFKTFSLAAAVEEGVFNPNATYQSGSYDVLGQKINDHNVSGWGTISYLEGVQRSSNTAFAKLLEQMGDDVYRNYLDDFGFGQMTDIDLPNEAPGNILYNYPIEKVTTIFGQGTTVTPLQMIQAETAIAGDGKMKKPFVLSKVVDPETGDAVYEGEPEVSGQPISADTASKVREYLASTVTSEVGTGQPFNIPGYEVAGKSGTAQIPDSQTGRYMTGRSNYLFSFIGMAPADDPELIVYIGVQQPDLPADEISSIPVSKVFNPVMLNSLKYRNIQPAEAPVKENVTVEDYTGQDPQSVKEKLEGEGLSVEVMGNGSSINHQSNMHDELMAGERLILVTDEELTIPDFTGWSYRDVVKAAATADLELNATGTGFATQQNLTANTAIDQSQPLTVKFETPEETRTRLSQPQGEDEDELPQG